MALSLLNTRLGFHGDRDGNRTLEGNRLTFTSSIKLSRKPVFLWGLRKFSSWHPKNPTSTDNMSTRGHRTY